ncbi:MAG TPA: TSUP family transporter, partial [Balneolaceae bacterium]|nr:TSUP family transporter [Balneolaceae bacterium]
MIWLLLAGLLAGFAVGFIGAGAAVIGLPFLLYLNHMAPGNALGTNALGVAFTIILILLYRIYKKDVYLKAGLAFALPGLGG